MEARGKWGKIDEITAGRCRPSWGAAENPLRPAARACSVRGTPHRMQYAPSGTSWPQEGQVTMSGGHSHGRFRGMSTPWDAEGWFGSEE